VKKTVLAILRQYPNIFQEESTRNMKNHNKIDGLLDTISA
jgi:hypothetical protein